MTFPKPTKATRSKRTKPDLAAFYAFAASHPCVVCGAHPVELHHLARIPSLKSHEYLPRKKGPARAAVVTLCATHHRDGPQSVHNLGESMFENVHMKPDGWLKSRSLALLAAYITGEE